MDQVTESGKPARSPRLLGTRSMPHVEHPASQHRYRPDEVESCLRRAFLPAIITTNAPSIASWRS
jgi:hypothetical protein